MRTTSHVIYYPHHADRFRLWFLTDLHLGAKACDEKLLAKHIKAIADDENALWIGGGDYIDAIQHHDRKRYKPETIAKWALGHTNVVAKQKEYFLDMTAPIASQCLAMACGNHEWESDKHYGGSVYWDMAKAVAERKGVEPGTLALGVEGFVNIVFRLGQEAKPNGGNHAWKMAAFVHHGFGGGRLAGGDALTLERALNQYACDLLFMGHRHVFRFLDVQRAVPGGKTARQREVWGVMMRGYLNQWIEPEDDGFPIDTYPEEKGLPPRGVGAFPVEIIPFERKFKLLHESVEIGK